MSISWFPVAAGALLVGVLHVSAGAARFMAVSEPLALGQGPASEVVASPEQQAEELTVLLQLSSKQKLDVTAILKNRNQQLEALRTSSVGNRSRGHSNLRRLESLTDSYMQTVLSLHQYNQYYALKYPPRSNQKKKNDKVELSR